MKVSTRADWGCPGGYDRPIPQRLGYSIHYPGPGRFRFDGHQGCLNQVKSWDTMHRNRGSVMLEYGGLVCQHGYYIEGRGTWGDLMQQPGSNGTSDANRKYPSLQMMMGTDDAPPTDQEYRWAGEVVARGFAQGLQHRVIGHRDTYATACPGDPIYNNLALIKGYALNAPPPPAGGGNPTIGEFDMFLAKDDNGPEWFLVGPTSILHIDERTLGNLKSMGVPEASAPILDSTRRAITDSSTARGGVRQPGSQY